jgi:hypothetical protein
MVCKYYTNKRQWQLNNIKPSELILLLDIKQSSVKEYNYDIYSILSYIKNHRLSIGKTHNNLKEILPQISIYSYFIKKDISKFILNEIFPLILVNSFLYLNC